MATSTQTTSGEQQQQPQNQQITPIYINRDRLGRKTIQNRQPLFNVDYSVERHYTKRSSSSNTGTQLNRLSIEQLTHIELIESSLFPVEPSSNESSNKNHEVYKLELTLRDDITTNGTVNGTSPKLMLGKYTIRIAVSDRLNPTCTPRQDLFHVYVGNDLIDQDELIELLKSIRHRNSSAPSTFDSVSSMKKTNNEANSDANDDYDPKVIKFSSNDYLFFGGPKPANNKGRNIHRYFNGDFVLLFVLILIVVVITLFLTFVSIVCLYGRYKKQYKLSGKKPKTPFSSSPSDSDGKKKSPLATDEEDESVNFTGGGSSRLKSSVKKKFLNTSTSSSEANSDELAMDKPQYTRYNIKWSLKKSLK